MWLPQGFKELKWLCCLARRGVGVLNISTDYVCCRVKKPDEFNRPRIPVSERKIKRSKIFVSKKVCLLCVLGLLIIQIGRLCYRCMLCCRPINARREQSRTSQLL